MKLKTIIYENNIFIIDLIIVGIIIATLLVCILIVMYIKRKSNVNNKNLGQESEYATTGPKYLLWYYSLQKYLRRRFRFRRPNRRPAVVRPHPAIIYSNSQLVIIN